MLTEEEYVNNFAVYNEIFTLQDEYIKKIKNHT